MSSRAEKWFSQTVAVSTDSEPRDAPDARVRRFPRGRSGQGGGRLLRLPSRLLKPLHQSCPRPRSRLHNRPELPFGSRPDEMRGFSRFFFSHTGRNDHGAAECNSKLVGWQIDGGRSMSRRLAGRQRYKQTTPLISLSPRGCVFAPY